MTLIDGVFSCGNAMHVSDIVDYVSESGEVAGLSAARYIPRERSLAKINACKDFLYCFPQCLDYEMLRGETVLYFRSRDVRDNTTVKVIVDGQEVLSEQFSKLRPPEMERLVVDFGAVQSPDSKVDIRMDRG